MLASHRIKLMGTHIDVQIESHRADDLLNQVESQLMEYNQIFSANDSQSVLSAVNLAAGQNPVKVPELLYQLIKIGKSESLLYDSNLNIALGPLIQTWRIGFTDAKVPSQNEIERALALTDPNNIIMADESHEVFLAQPGMKIDLGALAKGYFADLIISFLKNQGVTSALINLGGNVLVTGPNPKRETGTWFIGIQNPKLPRGQHLGTLRIAEQSVVTSGIYERVFKVNGKAYHHIFDKETGYPIESDVASLTIVADSSLDCEIWTTKLFGKSSLQALYSIEQTPGIEGIVITKDDRLAISSGLKGKFFPSQS
ncbi:FAD:protein FMN transferase [Streptococcus caprae]|uniref:FAD:protein FMN transferase n=1 Tax=Streptococcus caprae TaxID=1640501 RepID=A0ABV8CXW3_9STRE